MLKKTTVFIIVLSLYVLGGCAAMNKGAEKTGEAAGKAMRVPISASEGTAKGIAGEPESNPYKR
ncbi:MAG: hypothetical protein ABFR82_07790 [Nitrospirota bacterium]